VIAAACRIIQHERARPQQVEWREQQHDGREVLPKMMPSEHAAAKPFAVEQCPGEVGVDAGIEIAVCPPACWKSLGISRMTKIATAVM
jgi:hypothetical protein